MLNLPEELHLRVCLFNLPEELHLRLCLTYLDNYIYEYVKTTWKTIGGLLFTSVIVTFTRTLKTGKNYLILLNKIYGIVNHTILRMQMRKNDVFIKRHTDPNVQRLQVDTFNPDLSN